MSLITIENLLSDALVELLTDIPDKFATVVSLIVAWIYVASTAFRLFACEYVIAPVIIIGPEAL